MTYLIFTVETWILLVTFFCLFVLYGSWTHGVFEKMGIPGPRPVLYMGTLTKTTSKVYFLADQECALQYGRVWGIYEMRQPMLAVMDPDMLRTILVKDCFTNFTNHRNLGLLGDLRNAMSLSDDDKWRRLRNIITPAYTSGQVKEMFKLMKYHSSKMVKSLKERAQRSEVITVKDVFGSYSIDVMGSCILSVDMDVTNNPPEELMRHASNLFNIPIPLFMLIGFFPFIIPVLDWLGVAFFSRSSFAFFKNIVEKIRQDRNNNSRKNHADLLQYLTCIQSSNKLKGETYEQVLSDHELLCQLVMFVVGGYDTSASALTFLAYNLAQNPHIMSRLQEEIDATFPNNAPVEYEALMQMEYLDCVFNENLRLYPSIARTDRVAKETVTIKGITIPKNMVVMVPFYALHRDPELWPEPEEFKPERFSKENKEKIHPYSYMPFGVGPRNCVGMRFAQAAVKLALVDVLRHYSFCVCEETEIPLEMSPTGLMGPVRPIRLRIQLRSDKEMTTYSKCTSTSNFSNL
uniref:unspecific monooxygenase n=1 Tax=Periophthalmus magnuspinnatus TaxID=409849 RepID=A0A3B4B7N2_9GOBI